MSSNCSLKSCSQWQCSHWKQVQRNPHHFKAFTLAACEKQVNLCQLGDERTPASTVVNTDTPKQLVQCPTLICMINNLKFKKKKPTKKKPQRLKALWALQFKTAHWKAAWMINLTSLTVTYFIAINFRAVRTAGKSCYVEIWGYICQRFSPPLPCLETCSCRYYRTYPSGTGTCFEDFGCGQRRGWGWPPHSECCEGRAPGGWWLQAQCLTPWWPHSWRPARITLDRLDRKQDKAASNKA